MTERVDNVELVRESSGVMFGVITRIDPPTRGCEACERGWLPGHQHTKRPA